MLFERIKSNSQNISNNSALCLIEFMNFISAENNNILSIFINK